MKLICRTCLLPITKEVSELPDTSLLNFKDGEVYINESFYVIDDNSMHLDIKDAVIINIKDLINSNRHLNSSRLNGCCGMDGLDGMNRVCFNNHEIGTEKSDCWMPHFVALNPEKVEFNQAAK